jgi:hypothetical protein
MSGHDGSEYTLCVTFEEWYLGDGTYPLFHCGEKVNLSFYIPTNDFKIADMQESYFKQIKDSDYSFSGQVIRNYKENDGQLIIIDTGTFKFYMEIPKKKLSLTVGQFICGSGSLLIDYYAWVENLRNYENPPDLFYNFKVAKIRKVQIPEKFIYRNDKAMSYPSSLSPNDCTENDILEIEDMDGDNGNTSFYLLDLKTINEEVVKTFCNI